nr:hypothetical protein CFP56_33039 [Quercus suber]
MHDCSDCLEEDLCLPHIAGDYFCLFWKSLTGSDTFRIHCLKFQVAKYQPIVGSTYCLASSGLKSFLNGLVGYSQSTAWDYLVIGLVVWNNLICHTNANWKTNQFDGSVFYRSARKYFVRFILLQVIEKLPYPKNYAPLTDEVMKAMKACRG